MSNTTEGVTDMHYTADLGVTDYYTYEYVFLGDPGRLVSFYQVLVYFSGAIGVITNGFVLLVLGSSKKFRSKVSSMLLLNQATADLFTSAMVLLTYACWFSGVSSRVSSGILGSIYCHLVHNEVLLYTGLYTSALNMAVMAGERLLIIMSPLTYRLSCMRVKVIPCIIATWVISFSCNFTAILSVHDIIESECMLRSFTNNMTVSMVIDFIVIALTYILPLTFMLYAYSHMIIKIKYLKAGKFGINTQGDSVAHTNLNSAQKNLTMCMFVIAVTFILTWTPIQIYYLLFATGMPLSFSDAYYYVAMSLAITNSCINPFLYILKYKQFQKETKYWLCSKGKKRPQVGSVYTVNTSEQII